MDYKSLMGYGKKKKVVKEQPKPKKESVVDDIKKELNEWTDTAFKTMPKRWSGSSDKALTEFEQQGGKDNVNEGPAYEYAKVYGNAEKAYMQFQKAIDELGRFTTKKTGEKTDQKIFEKQWKKQVTPFYKLMKSWIRGKM